MAGARLLGAGRAARGERAQLRGAERHDRAGGPRDGERRGRRRGQRRRGRGQRDLFPARGGVDGGGPPAAGVGGGGGGGREFSPAGGAGTAVVASCELGFVVGAGEIGDRRERPCITIKYATRCCRD